MNDDPIYVSKPHRGSRGQEYRIYHDRIELRAKMLFTTLKIKLKNIDLLVARDSKIRWSDMYRNPLDFWWIYNNDRGGDKVVFIRQKAWPSRINFTPENPDEFVAKCNELMEKL
ncbi:MAG: hypothetical protein GY795_44190 [Desulfobacterales bacterium]|nr:hypothetical protein [Desulfobacterales bacterium]